MNRHPADESWYPRPEELAAYADGELPAGRLRQRVEDWLADHPEAAGEVEALRRLARLWRSSAAPEPDEAAWAEVGQRIHQAVPRGPTPAGRGLAGKIALALGLLVSAAAVLLAINLPAPPPDERKPADAEAVEPLPVATADEVEIVRIGGEDTDGPVVGELPVQGPLELAKPGEVVVQSIQPNKDKTMPEVRTQGRDAPMVWISPAEDAGN
jgi:hypothetical protein